MNNRLIVGDEVKFREWQFGKLIAVDGDSAEVLMSNGTKIIKNKNELVKNKMLPRYIDIIANRYRFRYKGKTIDYYDTVEEAVIARDKYLEELK